MERQNVRPILSQFTTDAIAPNGMALCRITCIDPWALKATSAKSLCSGAIGNRRKALSMSALYKESGSCNQIHDIGKITTRKNARTLTLAASLLETSKRRSSVSHLSFSPCCVDSFIIDAVISSTALTFGRPSAFTPDKRMHMPSHIIEGGQNSANLERHQIVVQWLLHLDRVDL